MLSNPKSDDLKNIVKDHFDKYADSWHDKLKQHAFAERKNVVARLLKNRTYKKVLDIGCGTGDYAELFKSEVPYYLGIDISPKMVEKAKSLYPEFNFEVGDAINTHQSDNSFDLVLSIAVLDYFETADEHFNEISRITMPNGFIIVAVPNKDDHSRKRDAWMVNLLLPFRKVKRIFLPPKPIPPQASFNKNPKVIHTPYSVDEFREHAKNVGLKLTRHKYASLHLNPLFIENYFSVNPGIEKVLNVPFLKPLYNFLMRRYASMMICEFQKIDEVLPT